MLLASTIGAAWAQAPASPEATPPAAGAPTVPKSDGQPDAKAPAPTENKAGPDIKVLAAISALDPMIGDVQLVGPWTDGERHGVWRTVMTQPAKEDGGNRFFVQQIEQSAEGSRVSSSVEITEIADVKGAVVGYRADPPAEGQESNLTLFFDILPLDGEVTDTYELFIAPNTPYRFGPASN
ncbi:hypothetical protein [Aureimonas sp. D3]|nr:hypothetical protein [Aureimonas sp. D3]